MVNCHCTSQHFGLEGMRAGETSPGSINANLLKYQGSDQRSQIASVMDPETQLTHPVVTFTCGVQEDVLRGCLGRFYSRAKGEEEGTELYSRTKKQARLLLLHLLVVALIADDYSLGTRHFEALRAALKLTPQDLVAHFKCAVCLSSGSFGYFEGRKVLC